MVKAIVTSYNCFYCGTCRQSHKILYIDGKKHYCTRCLPSNVDKSKIQYMNQNRDILIDFKEDTNE